MKKFTLNFNGYWTDRSQTAIPNAPGVYCVYKGKDSGQTVSISDLLYVGESENVRDRIICHERRSDWRGCLQFGETLIFSTAPITADRVQAEAAIINQHKPRLCTEFCNTFPFEDTEMTLLGQVAELTTFFIVTQTDSFLESLLARRQFGRSW